jgi:uncharacterized protein YecE (DUF72 family)
MENVLVGAKGWHHDNWRGSYYPDDLPEDWTLDFYSNQFYCVLVEQSLWMDWNTEEIEEIAENLADENFLFTFQLKTAQGGSQLQKIKDILGVLFHSVLVYEGINIALYQRLEVEVTKKLVKADETVEYAGFPMLELDLAMLNIAEQKEQLLAFKESLPNEEIGGLIYITNTEENQTLIAKKIIDFQVLTQLLGL